MKILNRWEVIRTIWPYPEGWGVWQPSTRTIIDTGLPKEEAERICKEMNS